MKILNNFNSSDLYFVSDLHFYHKNIISYCNRPFGDVEYMNKRLIEEWNKTVPKNGIVFMLGDFCFTDSKEKWVKIVEQLNGIIYHISGNHDKYCIMASRPNNYISDTNDRVDILEITVNDDEMSDGYQEITMCHFPMLAWNNSHRNSWNLYGHVHGAYPNPKYFTLDVGVDNVAKLTGQYRPLSYEEIKIILTKEFLENAKSKN